MNLTYFENRLEKLEDKENLLLLQREYRLTVINKDTFLSVNDIKKGSAFLYRLSNKIKQLET
jgi:hypothetical protein